MTEIEITVKRAVRFEGEHCAYDCDFCNGYTTFEYYCQLNIDNEIKLSKISDELGRFVNSLRTPACIEKFGLNGEKR